MYQIEELPDLKVAWHESYKCLNEPLLEYVWEVIKIIIAIIINVWGACGRKFESCHPD